MLEYLYEANYDLNFGDYGYVYDSSVICINAKQGHKLYFPSPTQGYIQLKYMR